MVNLNPTYWIQIQPIVSSLYYTHVNDIECNVMLTDFVFWLFNFSRNVWSVYTELFLFPSTLFHKWIHLGLQILIFYKLNTFSYLSCRSNWFYLGLAWNKDALDHWIVSNWTITSSNISIWSMWEYSSSLRYSSSNTSSKFSQVISLSRF